MSEQKKIEFGTVTWMDLTVKDAENLKDFYSQVTGWKSSPQSMGEYDDYVMLSTKTNQPIGGICHARGGNAELPPFWLIYINVENIDESLKRCKELGGKALFETKTMPGYGKFSVIQDPAGAFSALFEPINQDQP